MPVELILGECSVNTTGDALRTGGIVMEEACLYLWRGIRRDSERGNEAADSTATPVLGYKHIVEAESP